MNWIELIFSVTLMDVPRKNSRLLVNNNFFLSIPYTKKASVPVVTAEKNSNCPIFAFHGRITYDFGV